MNKVYQLFRITSLMTGLTRHKLTIKETKFKYKSLQPQLFQPFREVIYFRFARFASFTSLFWFWGFCLFLHCLFSFFGVVLGIGTFILFLCFFPSSLSFCFFLRVCLFSVLLGLLPSHPTELPSSFLSSASLRSRQTSTPCFFILSNWKFILFSGFCLLPIHHFFGDSSA